MLRPIYLLLLALIYTSSYAQFADIRGNVVDPKLDYAMQGALVSLIKDGATIKSVISASEGAFQFNNLQAGNYSLTVEFNGYGTYSLNFNLRSDQSKFMRIEMSMTDNIIDAVDIRDKRELDVTGGGDIPFDGDKIKEGPYSNALGTVANDPTITKFGNGLRFSDARAEQTKVSENGIIGIGLVNPTSLGIGQVRAISKGVPVMYGDFTGGLIEITSKRFLDTLSRFTAQLTSSQLLEPYNRNALETLWYHSLMRRDSQAILGLSHSMYFSHNRDGNPVAIQNYRFTDASQQRIYEQPFGLSESGDPLSAYFFTNAEDFEEIKTRNNVSSLDFYNSFTLQYAPNHKVGFAVTPSLHYNKSHLYSFSNSLFNAEHNPLNTSTTFKVNAQMSHALKQPYNDTGKLLYDSLSSFSAINYLIIVDYQQFNSQTVDPIYKDNIFNYGYIGEFRTKGEALYQFIDEDKSVTDQHGNQLTIGGYNALVGYQDTALTFQTSSKSSRNTFTQYVFDQNAIRSYEEAQEYQALLNGQQANNIYSMWYAPGTVISNYNKSQNEKLSISGILNLAWHPTKDFMYKHDVQFGFMFEQSNRSYYSLNATALWNLMPQLLNRQYIKLDTDNPILSYDEKGVFLDTVNYNWIVDPNQQTQFDKNLRAIVDGSNGYTLQNAQFIDVNSVDPDKLSLDMFSANDLWNNGNSYVNYAGYDYLGNRTRGRSSINDFLNNPAERSISSFNPIYTAIWLQDKFVLDKINFRVGVRIERYDANQAVLKDKYSLYPVRTAAEISTINNESVVHPSTIGDDFKVYVDDAESPTQIVGYRNGSQWYDERGNEIVSAELIRSKSSKGVIQPYLVDPLNQKLSDASFKDYEPELVVLPRLSFSFPINSEALFFAYYDKFAQRPNFGQSFTPINHYYYIQNNANSILPNPDLKASKRTDYQIGFRQQIGRASLISLTAGYAEIFNDINLVNVDQAYPVSYITYDNIDFSTIKNFKTEFTTQMNQIYFRASYMLQFADGTGSNVNSAQALIAANQPNLRSLFPLAYDVRHKININMSLDLYEFGDIICSPLMKNTSLNIFFNTQSGSPYTAYLNAISEAQNLGNASRSQVKGNPFGSRLPWNTNLDLSFLKKFHYREQLFEFQFNVLNLFNNLNIFNVYSYSASATDDGYLSSPQGVQQIQNQVDATSFAYLYNLKQRNPNHFGQPRTMSITLRANF